MSEVPPQPCPTLTETLPTVLWIPQLVAIQGLFPVQGGPPSYTIGMIQSFAALYDAYGAPTASGQVLEINASNVALFSLFQFNFGGDGRTTFAYPALDGVTAVGGTPGQTGIDTLQMTWLIAAQQGSPFGAPLAGMLALFGGSSVPGGWLAADGSTYPISAWPDLFNAIGNTFGGDGQTNFAVPNLTGAAPVGTGISPGGAMVTMGEQVQGQTPGLGLDYLICTNGILPPEGGNGTLPSEFFLGQIVAWAGNVIPQGWQACDGSLLSIQRQNGLYQVIGTLYGGDGTSTYAVPNLSGLMIQGRTIGETVSAGPESSARAAPPGGAGPAPASRARFAGRRIPPVRARRKR